MSYEGHEQLFCAAGHVSIIDASVGSYSSIADEVLYKCRVNGCVEKVIVINCVDETNCEPWPWNGEVELEVAVAPPVCTCTCGHRHSTGPTTFKVPSLDPAVRRRDEVKKYAKKHNFLEKLEVYLRENPKCALYDACRDIGLEAHVERIRTEEYESKHK